MSLSLRIAIPVWMSLAASVYAPAQTRLGQDPITIYLGTKGLSNIPYANQTDAEVGTVISSPFSDDVGPTFYPPFGSVPTPKVPVNGTFIPGGKLEVAKDAGLELGLFGFLPSIEFANSASLTYSDMTLTSEEININQVNELLKVGSPTDLQLRTHVKVEPPKKILGISRGTGVYFDATYYLIAKTYVSTGTGDITSVDGKEITAKTGASIPKCTYATDAPKDNAPKPSDTDPKPDAANPTVKTVVNNALNNAAKLAGSMTTAAVKAATSSTPSGGVKYCLKNGSTVHYQSAHPFLIAMYVYLLNLNPADNYKTWKAMPQVVVFNVPKITTE